MRAVKTILWLMVAALLCSFLLEQNAAWKEFRSDVERGAYDGKGPPPRWAGHL